MIIKPNLFVRNCYSQFILADFLGDYIWKSPLYQIIVLILLATLESWTASTSLTILFDRINFARLCPQAYPQIRRIVIAFHLGHALPRLSVFSGKVLWNPTSRSSLDTDLNYIRPRLFFMIPIWQCLWIVQNTRSIHRFSRYCDWSSRARSSSIEAACAPQAIVHFNKDNYD